MIFDTVEKELLRERQLILDVQDQLEDLFGQIVLQIRKLRIFYLYLDNDFNCKLNTLKIEHHNATLNEHNVDLSVLNDKTVIKPTYVFIPPSAFREIFRALNSYCYRRVLSPTGKYPSWNGTVSLRI